MKKKRLFPLLLLAILLPSFAFGNEGEQYFRLNEHYSHSHLNCRELAASLLTKSSVLGNLSDVKIISIERTAGQRFQEWVNGFLFGGPTDQISARITIEGRDEIGSLGEIERFTCKMIVGNFRDETVVVICPGSERPKFLPWPIVLRSKDLGIYPLGG